jgi:histone-lysine N-methyltransferase SETMAR
MAKRKQAARTLVQRLRVRGRRHGAIVKSVGRVASRELQRGKIIQLLSKDWSPSKIHHELQQKYGPHVYSLRTVEYYRRKQLKQIRGDPPKTPGRPRRTEVGEKIKALRAAGGKTSVRKTALLIKEPRSTTYDHFVALGGSRNRIRRVPHELTDVDKGNRMMIAEEMLKIVNVKKFRPSIITGDESWIYHDNTGTAEWVFPGEETTAVQKRQQGDRKLMLVAFFNSQRIVYADFLEAGTTQDSVSFCETLDELVSHLPSIPSKTVWLHVDNAPSHTSKHTQNHLKMIGFTPLPHPAYSPDLAPCDFYLFGRLKNCLLGKRFKTDAELKKSVLDHLYEVSHVELRRVFNNWIRRLNKCINDAGEYIE